LGGGDFGHCAKQARQIPFSVTQCRQGRRDRLIGDAETIEPLNESQRLNASFENGPV
jgi:hypothetical protein